MNAWCSRVFICCLIASLANLGARILGITNLFLLVENPTRLPSRNSQVVLPKNMDNPQILTSYFETDLGEASIAADWSACGRWLAVINADGEAFVDDAQTDVEKMEVS